LILQFGSTVTGAVHPRSDVDLAVLLQDGHPSLHKLAEIHHGLQECFPEREVDLAVINRADPLFLKKIMERCKLVYGSTRDLQELRIYAFKRYQDHRRFLEMERRYVERTLPRFSATS
ncbi:MAG TPA: nucleotidyltransferase domain-containing protein, partial [Nitrospiraceae bacterium]|nr:nucleotidyltransferase domain-containing protein [Nitrospiraceae bacterium]